MINYTNSLTVGFAQTKSSLVALKMGIARFTDTFKRPTNPLPCITISINIAEGSIHAFINTARLTELGRFLARAEIGAIFGIGVIFANISVQTIKIIGTLTAELCGR